MKKKKILLRFDDICPTMNWEQWGKAKQLMDEKGVVALLGVIPDCKDPDLMIEVSRSDFWEYIRELQDAGYTIAMHGYQHLFELKANGLVTKNKISEFAGLPYDLQLYKIREGKKIMEEHGLHPIVFFAPAHSYDRNTIKALKENGFRYISDGLSQSPYRMDGIVLLPCGVKNIFHLNKKEMYETEVFHAHEWIKEEKKADLCHFQSLLAGHSHEIVSFEEYSKRKIANKTVQRLYEQLYILLVRYFIPPLIRLRKTLKK